MGNVCWVSRERIFLSKKEGGLGVKSIKNFNFSLISNGWRLLSENEALWSNLLHFMSGDGMSNLFGKDSLWVLKNSLLWWRDVREVCNLKVGG